MNPSSKVIHLPLNIGGNPQGISRSLQKLGISSETWVISQNYFNFNADKVICLPTENRFFFEIKKFFGLRYIFKCNLVFFNGGRGLYKPFNAIYQKRYSKIQFYSQVCFHFYSKFMAVIEVSLLKLFKRSIFIVYQGSDARQNDYCEKNFEISMPYKSFTKTGSIEFDEMKRESISFYSKVADKIYSLNPDLLHVLPKSAEFLPYSHINLNDWLPVYIQNENTPLRIGHAPSNKGLKGTSFIIKAIENLKRRGCDIEFVLIEGISNEKAKQLYKSLDLVIDQLLSGWYGGLAVEAMALGKPVVAYIRHSDLHFIDPIMKQELPIYEANPQTIEKVLEGIIKLPRRELYRRGVASRKFVENWHNPMKIGNKIKCDIIQASKNFH